MPDGKNTAPLDQIIADLRAGLEGVTPGPWFEYSEPEVGYFHSVHANDPESKYGSHSPVWDNPYNTAHIARCSPDNIAAILNALSEATSGAEKAEDEADSMANELDSFRSSFKAELGWRDRCKQLEAERDDLRLRAVGKWVFPPDAQQEIDKLNAALERAEAERDAAVGDWRTDNPPQDGTPIYKRVIQPYRFLPYKPNSQQAKRGEKGRWQMMNEYGGWENCPWPLGNEWSLTHPSERRARSQEKTP